MSVVLWGSLPKKRTKPKSDPELIYVPDWGKDVASANQRHLDEVYPAQVSKRSIPISCNCIGWDYHADMFSLSAFSSTTMTFCVQNISQGSKNLSRPGPLWPRQVQLGQCPGNVFVLWIVDHLVHNNLIILIITTWTYEENMMIWSSWS